MPRQLHQRNRIVLQGLALLLGITTFASVALASSGTISGTSKYTWSTTGGWVNFNPTNGNVQVTDTGLTGYAWSQNDGWINLAPTNGGVHNDGSGTLSGFAWDQSAGWIDFTGVTIDSNGAFHGEAVGTKNTINFGCTSCNVITTWTSASQTTPAPSSPSGPTVIQVEQPPPPAPVPTEPPPAEQPPAQETPGQDGEATPPGLGEAAAGAASGGSSSVGGGSWIPRDITNISKAILLFPLAGFTIKQVALATASTSVAVVHTASTPVLSTGVAVGTLGILWSLFSTLKGLSDLPLLFTSSLSSLFPLAYLRRKDRPWGTVYDSKTRRPLDPAVVTLRDASGKELKTVITDLDGRFGFLAAPGTYSIVAQKSHHVFPAADVPVIDPLYPQPYRGEPIMIGEEGVIVKDIPLDPVEFDWNEYEKYRKGLYRFFSRFDRPLAYASLVLTPLGALFSFAAVLITPNVLNLAFLALYGCMSALYVLGFSPRIYGTLRDQAGSPLVFASVKAFYPDKTTTTTHTVSDHLGRFYLLLPKGKEFDIEVAALTGPDTYTSVFKGRYTGLVGHFNKDIKLS